MATQAKSAGQAKASNKVVVLLSVLLLGTIILALFTFLHVSQRSSYDEKYLLRSSDERIHSQRIAKFALAAARGDTDAFAMLKKSRDQFARILQELREGSAADSLPPSPQEVKPQLDALDRSWIRLNQGVELVLKNQQDILGVGQFVKVITDLLPQLQRNFEDVVKILLKQKASQHQVFLATNQLMLAQRIEHNASRVLAGGQATDIAIEQFGKDAEQFGKVLEGMLRGDAEMGIQQVTNAEVEQKLREVAMLFTTIKQHAEEIIRITPNVLPAVDAANKLTESSDVVNDAAEQLISAFRESPGRISILGIKAGPVLISVLGALSTLLLVLLGWTLVRESRRQAAERDRTLLHREDPRSNRGEPRRGVAHPGHRRADALSRHSRLEAAGQNQASADRRQRRPGSRREAAEYEGAALAAQDEEVGHGRVGALHGVNQHLL